MNKFTLLVVLLVAAMMALIAFMAQSTKDERQPRPIAEVLAIASDDFVLGNAQSPVVVVEYFDFECPACRAQHSLVKELVAEHGDRFALVVRHFPLSFHRNAHTAAWAFEAAARQGKAVEMAELIFEHQDTWAGKASNAALFYPYAEGLGLDIQQFQEDIFSDAIKKKVDRHLKEGRSIGIQATPTFFVNGQQVQGIQGVSDFIQAVEEKEPDSFSN